MEVILSVSDVEELTDQSNSPLTAFHQGGPALPCVFRVPGFAGMNGLILAHGVHGLIPSGLFFLFMLRPPLLGWPLTACSKCCSRVILHPPIPRQSTVQR